ncbi:hypothetical protein C8J56DRAFT_1067018 [Mycena floridula]|nr:hypothetical protein C8J56DRAFT_1067018 [Mycena floridula]
MVSLFESAAPQPQVETSLSPAYDQLPVKLLSTGEILATIHGAKKGYVIVIVLLSMQHTDFSSESQGLESGDTAPRMGLLGLVKPSDDRLCLAVVRSVFHQKMLAEDEQEQTGPLSNGFHARRHCVYYHFSDCPANQIPHYNVIRRVRRLGIQSLRSVMQQKPVFPKGSIRRTGATFRWEGWHEKNTVGTVESMANPQLTNPFGKTSRASDTTCVSMNKIAPHETVPGLASVTEYSSPLIDVTELGVFERQLSDKYQ